MSAIKRRYHGNKENIFKIAEEYCKLIELSSPSDIELERINAIMELAVYDTELDNLINQADEQYAINNNLLGDNYLDEESSPSVGLDNLDYPLAIDNNDDLVEVKYKNKGSTQQSGNASNVILFPRLASEPVLHSKNKRKFFNINTRVAVYSFLAGGILTFFGIAELCNNFKNSEQLLMSNASTVPNIFYKQPPTQYGDDYLLSHASNTEISVCNSNNDVSNQQIKDYYKSFSKLENRILTQQLQPLEIRNQVRDLQRKAELQQRKAEENQRYAETQTLQAQMQNRYDEAQTWKTKAQNLLSESQKWLCLSRQALNLSIR